MNNSSNIGIVFSNLGPYHVARIEALGAELKTIKASLIAFRFSEASVVNGWEPVTPKGVYLITLAPRYPAGVFASVKLALSFARKLKKHKISTVFLPGYAPLPNFLCLLSVKLLGRKAILMTESWGVTEKAGFLGRMIKRWAINSFDAGLVGGTPQKEYLCNYGVNPSKIFFGYDVVDVDYFSRECSRWRDVKSSDLPVRNLPERFFLSLGRLVPKKNLDLLIRAYDLLAKKFIGLDISLVFVGEGSEEARLRGLVRDLSLSLRNGQDARDHNTAGPEVVFYPFQQVDKTPLFFSRCECFILPSAYEEWGLVVNEAMACGVPVLVSNMVGSTRDLLVNDKNGYSFEPDNPEFLAKLLAYFISDPLLRNRLGSFGQKHIADWGPQRFATGGRDAFLSIK